jgi:hypothetical protein
MGLGPISDIDKPFIALVLGLVGARRSVLKVATRAPEFGKEVRMLGPPFRREP